MRRITFSFALLSALAAAPLPLSAQQPGNALPPGDGHDIVAVACSQCHGLNAITQLREGPQAWRHEIYDMIERGAQIAPSEMDKAVDYLATNFGPGVAFPGQTPAQVTLPAGQGKEIVEGACALCHGVDRAVAAKRSKSQWEKILARMVYFGAPLSTDQAKIAVDYLSANFGSAEEKAAVK
jgi:mono/diheme cytochrome c family protein